MSFNSNYFSGDQHSSTGVADSDGDKHTLTQGGYDRQDMDEWKNQETHSTHKGNGYVKIWNWEKQYGENVAHGKKVSHAYNHHKMSQG